MMNEDPNVFLSMDSLLVVTGHNPVHLLYPNNKGLVVSRIFTLGYFRSPPTRLSYLPYLGPSHTSNNAAFQKKFCAKPENLDRILRCALTRAKLVPIANANPNRSPQPSILVSRIDFFYLLCLHLRKSCRDKMIHSTRCFDLNRPPFVEAK